MEYHHPARVDSSWGNMIRVTELVRRHSVRARSSVMSHSDLVVDPIEIIRIKEGTGWIVGILGKANAIYCSFDGIYLGNIVLVWM